MNEKKSVYEVLSSINVNKFVREKNGFKYLSWSDSVAILLENYPDATWRHREWDGKPYYETEGGCYVEVSVIVNNIERSQYHPVLDYRNKPISKPSAFQVNSSIQRALSKAISLHGLALYIYRNEDLPPSEREAIEIAKDELITLLKEKNKYSADAARFVSNMNYDQLTEKIAEYRNNG